MTLKDVIAELTRFRNLGGSVRIADVEDSESIIEVQDSLGIIFSPEFITFYREYQSLQIGPHEFLPVHYLAERYREQRTAKRLPAANLFPVLCDPMGGCYYLVCDHPRKRRDFELNRVLHVASVARPEDIDESHSNFFAFVVSIIHQVEEFLDE